MPVLRSIVIVLAVCAFAGVSSGQDVDIPRLDQRVTDFTNSLSFAEWTSLEKELKAFEDSTSNQILVLVVSSTGQTVIEEYANRVFEENRPGQEGKNNGVLIVVAIDDRAVRIEVGYGLEGVLTDALCRQVIEKEMKPRFRDEQYFGGLIAGVYAIAGAVAGEYIVDTRGKTGPGLGLGAIVFFGVVWLFFLRPLMTVRRRASISSRGSRYYSGWGWPGGFGGGGGSFGGGGGFSGGGGLSGVGGATGRW